MRKIIFILLVIFSFHCKAQTKAITFDITKIADSLRTVDVDTFIVYKNYFIGGHKGVTIDRNASKEEIREKYCEISDPIYIIYKSKGKTNIQKRNECYFYKTIPIDTSVAIIFFIKHFNEILKEKIYNNAYNISKDGDTSYVYQEHSGITEMYLSLGILKKEITIDWFDFSENSIVGQINLNYQHNINTKMKYFDTLLSNKLYSLVFTKD